MFPRLGEPVFQRDRSIGEHVGKALVESGYVDLRSIQCQVSDGFVKLTGCVSSFYVKQIAQTAVMRLQQVRGIENQLRVI